MHVAGLTVRRVLCLRGAVVSYSSSSVHRTSLQEAIIYSEIKCKNKATGYKTTRTFVSFHLTALPPSQNQTVKKKSKNTQNYARQLT